MAPPESRSAAPRPDWLGLCRRATGGVRAELRRYSGAERARPIGRGEGGDMTLAIDRAAEDVILAELEALGLPLTAISEERGEVAISGGASRWVVIDPIDGSLNAKRGLPLYSVSIAVAEGPTMGDVEFGYVADLAGDREWWAARDEGASGDGSPLRVAEGPELEVVGIETAKPHVVAGAAEGLDSLDAHRLRAIGSVALSLCFVAAGQLDAMASLGEVRSVDAAAGQLIVREAGGVVAFPQAGPDPSAAALDLGMRSRVLAASTEEALERLAPLG